jgi:peptidoglycan biosynthesis protein MviN/MurJ (putative lipid II flippase)
LGLPEGPDEATATALDAAPPGLAHTTKLGALAALNIFLGLLQHWYIITALGPGPEADALFASFVVPQLALAIVTNSVTQVLVPMLAIESRDGFGSAAWTFFLGLGLLFGISGLALAATASLWVPWTLPGFDDPTTVLTVRLLRIQTIGMVFTALSSVLWSIYQARARFLVIEISGAMASACVLALLAWGLPAFGVTLAAWAIVLRPVLQTVFLAPGLGEPRWPHWTSPTVSEGWRRLRPLLVGTTYYKTDQLVDRFFASMSAPGSLTLLYTAQQIYSAAQRILAKALVAPLVPTLASKSARADWSGVSRLAARRVLFLVLLGLASVGGLVVVGRPLLGWIFGLGRFEPHEVTQLWILLLALGAAFVARSAAQVVTSSFYAAGNTLIPTLIGSAGYTGGLILRGVFFHLWGVLGLAVAISVQAVVNASVLAYVLFARHLARRDR